MARGVSYFREVWAETFPDHSQNLGARMERRRQLAKMHREEEERLAAMTPEEIEEMEKSVPEWKRNALVTTEAEAEEDRPGVLGRLKSKVAERVGSTDAAKDFYASEEYGQLKEARANYSEFKSNLQEGVTNTQNPAVQRTM